MFSVTCPKNDDNSFPALFEIIKDFIEKENGKSVEVFEARASASTRFSFNVLRSDHLLGCQSHPIEGYHTKA